VLEDGNIGRPLRGNPEALTKRIFRDTGKVANLGRGGRLERVQPTFPLKKLWRATVGIAQTSRKAHERIGF
jgi:hypothetical protein